ncbi:cytochrome P450 [Pisolithus sp. B1]|nr:cytochrome P450 [Pisolithus sp. B1]
MNTSTSALSVSLLCFGALFFTLWKSRRQRASRTLLPPGPKGLPWVGNVLDVDASQPWVTYEEWGKRYGDLAYSQVLGKEYIIINSEKVAHEVVGPTVGSRVYHTNVAPKSAPSRPKQERISEIWNDAIAKGTWTPCKPAHDTAKTMKTTSQLEVATPERSALLGAFSFLAHIPSWMPGGHWKKRANDCRKLVKSVLDDPVQYVRDSMCLPATTNSKGFRHCEKIHERVTKEVAATAFMAGSETTTSALLFFLLAMVLHPDVQRKAQEEIDRVVDTDRLPNFGDRPNLPYVEAVLSEATRWIPVSALGVVIIPNVWAMAQDPVFNPDRYGRKLEDVALSPAFGFGRRVCPGNHLAEQSLWAVIVSMLATMHIGKATDTSGTEIEITPRLKSGGAILIMVPECPLSEHRGGFIQRLSVAECIGSTLMVPLVGGYVNS